VKQQYVDLKKDSCTVVREYHASDGIEFFISQESHNNDVLLGFVRLRITDNVAVHVFPELHDCALVRELHVYGQLQCVGSHDNNSAQHKGIGKHMMSCAENIAKSHGKFRVAVIAGEGTKGYYEKLGYEEHAGQGAFMIKDLV
jgi:elongator complex protein 3